MAMAREKRLGDMSDEERAVYFRAVWGVSTALVREAEELTRAGRALAALAERCGQDMNGISARCWYAAWRRVWVAAFGCESEFDEMMDVAPRRPRRGLMLKRGDPGRADLLARMDEAEQVARDDDDR